MSKPRGNRERRQKPDGGGGGSRRHQRKTITSVSSGQLPRWVRDEVVRSTPKERRDPALNHLSKGLQEFVDERYRAAVAELQKAKKLSPRAGTIRELLGLSAYRAGQWEESLRELRTFRRITGDLLHVPVEMDCLRALRRDGDIEKLWQQMAEHDLTPVVGNELRVVYGSFLLDDDRPREAWEVVKPARLVADPRPGELRRWFVAARAAMAAGDPAAARKILAAVDEQDVDFEGVDELRRALA